jgi:hypothetical protein
MDDAMPPLMSKAEAPPVKLEATLSDRKEERSITPSIKLEDMATETSEFCEGGPKVLSQLVAYSSSPLPFIEDCPGLIDGDTDSAQHSIISPLRSRFHRKSSSDPS